MDRCSYSEPYLASNLLQNRGEQADSREAEDRHHFQRWLSLTGPKINGCISLVAPSYSFSRVLVFWRSSGRAKEATAKLSISGIQGTQTPFPAQPPAASESLGSCSSQQSRLWAKKYQDNVPEIEREALRGHSPSKQGSRGEMNTCST